MKKVCKDSKNGKFLGVCEGIGNYFGIDPTIVRLFWLILIFAYGTGVLAYFICAMILPEKVSYD